MSLKKKIAPLSNKVSEIGKFLQNQSSLKTLRFITCGSVDDGKSTLIGRMLYEAQLIFDDQIISLENDSKKSGTQGADIDFALLVDGLAAEREQGITIDVAYRYFATDKRKFIVADTPGHEQYTRNMITGASTADAAIILVDARNGLMTQTKRHSYLCSLMGIQNIILAINKMDLIAYKKNDYLKIVEEYKSFVSDFNFKQVIPLPISALKGDNIVEISNKMKWYDGKTLISLLENISISKKKTNEQLRLPIQWVNRLDSEFRGFSGTIVSGKLKKGDLVSVLPNGNKAKILEVIVSGKSVPSAQVNQAVTFTLDKEIDISRGNMLVPIDQPCEISNQFQVKLVWMSDTKGLLGRSHLIKIGHQTAGAQITNIKHKINVNTFEKLPGNTLELNDICLAEINLDKSIIFENYNTNRALGSFILIDRVTNQTLAVGMINFSLRRSQNIYNQKLDVNKKSRQILNGHKSKVIWLTGLSGSGKSTIANALETRLHEQGKRTYILDGDNIRHGLSKDLGFTDSDRVENIRRIGEVAKLMVDAGIIVLTAFISPFRAERDLARSLLNEDEFKEVFIDVPLKIAEERDPKGLYKKAREGKIKNFTGIDSDYEKPLLPDYTFKTDKLTVKQIVEELLIKEFKD
jgi:bifunctional enzyme CysN/CysC|tara:strand:- start:6321 stop:8225 length:1905 start_codon:yes stop_codon:yes gene_type:complete